MPFNRTQQFIINNLLRFVTVNLPLYRVSKKNAMEIQQAVVHHKRS
jgi:hypothetical protein